MSSEPLPLETLGEELLVHSLSGEALPPGKGGPYRLFVPVADSKSPCQNMKQLWRILIEPPPQSPA